MGERWLPIIGYEGLYEVSDLGRVRSLDRIVSSITRGSYLKHGQVLKLQTTHDGYHVVHLCKNGRELRQRVNRLVLTIFFSPPPFSGAIANHKNSNRKDNHIDNLEWCSIGENNRHAILYGNSKPWINSPYKNGHTPWNKTKALYIAYQSCK